VDARNGHAHNDAACDEIALVAAHDVKHMLSRSGLHEIVQLARSVTESRQAPGPRPGPSGQQGSASRQGSRGPSGSVASHGGPRYQARGE
jgi:hypothetical protein